jgi:hypothetical protein
MDQPTQGGPPKGYWQKPNNYIRAATLLAVFIYTGIQGYQTYLIRANNIVSQRAFVYAEYTTAHHGHNHGDHDTPGWAMIFTMINSGATPTKGMTSYIRCVPSLDALPEPWPLLYREKVDYRPQVLGPHGTATLQCGFPDSQIQEALDGKLRLYILGDIHYRDRLDDSVPHRAEFAFDAFKIWNQQHRGISGRATRARWCA